MAIIKWRRATAAEWTAANSLLREGEAGFEKDTGKFKIGDGVSFWDDLSYFTPGSVGGAASFTDNGDGGFTSGSVKLGGFSWITSTFARIANAVPLSTQNPQPLLATPSAGTSNEAARIDHVHKMPLARPPVAFIPPGSRFTMGHPGGEIVPYQLNRACFGVIWIGTPSRKSLVVSKVSLYVTTAGAAGTTCRFGVWPTDQYGGPIWNTPMFTSAAIAADTSGMKEHVAPLTFPEGIYWVGGVNQGPNGAAQPRWRGLADESCIPVPGGNEGQMSNNYYLDGVTGSMSAITGANNGGDGTPALYFTAA